MPPRDATAPVVFLHAHPDDEAIFTGGSLRLLATAGIPAVVVFATSGEGGERPAGAGPDDDPDLGALRRDECRAAATMLGVSELIFLGHRDSGLTLPSPAGTFGAAPLETVADALAVLLRKLGAGALVTYDPHGIYGHPDHVAVHRVGRRAAQQAGVRTCYEATVDREYLHFVETHLVEEAQLALAGRDALPGLRDAVHASGQLGLAATTFGTPTVLIDLVVDTRTVLADKRAAMAAHASQIPASSSAFRLEADAFSEVYGLEWYRRDGPPGALEQLPRR